MSSFNPILSSAGLVIYKIEDPWKNNRSLHQTYLRHLFYYSEPVIELRSTWEDETDYKTSSLQAQSRWKLEPGTYVVIPYTVDGVKDSRTYRDTRQTGMDADSKRLFLFKC